MGGGLVLLTARQVVATSSAAAAAAAGAAATPVHGGEGSVEGERGGHGTTCGCHAPARGIRMELVGVRRSPAGFDASPRSWEGPPPARWLDPSCDRPTSPGGLGGACVDPARRPSRLLCSGAPLRFHGGGQSPCCVGSAAALKPTTSPAPPRGWRRALPALRLRFAPDIVATMGKGR